MNKKLPAPPSAKRSPPSNSPPPATTATRIDAALTVSLAGGKTYDVIRELIMNGTFRAGERLKENSLVELCNVSRTPVREALRRLASEGLVVVTPNAGAQVSTVSITELEEIYVLRAMMEGYAAHQAATRLAPATIARLKALAGAMETAVKQARSANNRAFVEANAEFHRIILNAAGSARLAAMASMVVDLSTTMRTFALYSPQDRTRSLRHHREMIEAFEANDPVWAESVMKSHMHAAYQTIARSHVESERQK